MFDQTINAGSAATPSIVFRRFHKIGSNNSIHRHRQESEILLLIAIIVFIGALLFAAGTIFTSDGYARFQVTESIVQRGSIDIPPADWIPIGRDGKTYAKWGLSHSLSMIPFYLVGKGIAFIAPSRGNDIVEFCASTVNLVYTVLLCCLLFKFVHSIGFSLRTAVALSLLYAFGTAAWQQSKDSFEHPQVAFYLTLAFYAMHKVITKNRLGDIVLLAVALAIGTHTRYTAFLAYLPVLLVLILHFRTLKSSWKIQTIMKTFLVFTAISVPFAALHLWYNYARFENVFSVGQAYVFSKIGPTDVLSALWKLSFDWEHGVFFYSPILLLLIPSVLMFYRSHALLSISIMILFVTNLSFYSVSSPDIWSGGWAWGCRHLNDVLPLLVLVTAPLVEKWAHKQLPTLLALGTNALILLSFMVQFTSVLVNYNRSFIKRSAEINNHSFHKHGFRESGVYLQLENVREIADSLWSGRGPGPIRSQTGGEYKSSSDLDRYLNFGTFQIWWIFLIHLGLAPLSVFAVSVAVSILITCIICLRRKLLTSEVLNLSGVGSA